MTCRPNGGPVTRRRGSTFGNNGRKLGDFSEQLRLLNLLSAIEMPKYDTSRVFGQPRYGRDSRLLEMLTLTAPFSPMRYDTSPGSIQTDSSAGKFSKMSVMGTPLSRAARSNTASIGSPVFRHRNAEPCKVYKITWTSRSEIVEA